MTPTQSLDETSRYEQKNLLETLDRLQFSKWHLFMVLSLGLVWIFDGYEVSLISFFRKYIVQEHDEQTFKSVATSYQVGCIFGSFVFGVSGFVFGRRKIFLITLIIYAFGIVLSTFFTQKQIFLFSRFVTGVSIGGEFTAIFAVIDEFLPPKYRGRVNIGIDGTWHLGGTLAAVMNICLGEIQNWRYLFAIGLVGIVSLTFMRQNIPQSPRWLLLNNRTLEAKNVVNTIDSAVKHNRIFLEPIQNHQNDSRLNIQHQLVSERTENDVSIKLKQQTDKKSFRKKLPLEQVKRIFVSICQTISFTIRKYKSRFFLAFFLMFSQALFFNLVYYKFPGILLNQYKLTQQQIGLYMLPLSLCSFLSTLIVGPLFDKVGRKVLLLVTYGSSGFLLFCSQQIQSLIWLEIFICFMFFFTSPAGSSANLIASQIFPTSSRTLILLIMFMVGMIGGIIGVWIDTIWIGSGLMTSAGILGYFICPDSENRSLQQIQGL